MRVIRHRKRDDGSYRLLVHTDPMKVDDEGKPDPEFVRRFDWAPKPPGMTQAEYVQMQLREAKLLLQAETAEGAGSKLASEDIDL